MAGYIVLALVLLQAITLSSTGYISDFYNVVKDNSVCRFMECCNADYVPFNVFDLEYNLKNKVFGQPLVMNLIASFEAHRLQLIRRGLDQNSILDSNVHGKALALSFHGWPGNGKNYVADFIVHSLYKKGFGSKFVKFYSARHDFPDENLVPEYKNRLKKEVMETIRKCGTSLFIFDEVEKMAPGVLDAIKPFIDHYSNIEQTVVRNSIFIFLSNYAGDDISMRMLELYEEGLTRNELRLSHFEQVIRKASYVDEGGFQSAAVISAQLIDHYIPFLPLEASHVRQCALAEFKYHDVLEPTDEMVNEAMSVITYGPTKTAPIFANAGCKRMKHQVAYVLQADKLQKGERDEL